jgi:hypothetical protein
MSAKTSSKRLNKRKSAATKAGTNKAKPSGSGGLLRKIKRKHMTKARKKFMKDFKNAMANFKLQVKCSECDRVPAEGENIDNWKINKSSENIDLICTDCYTDEEVQGEEDENSTEL